MPETDYYITPEIEIRINQKKSKVLIDIGSDVTCISENLDQQYNHIWKHCSVLPTRQFTLITAGGIKTAKINKKILLNLQLEDVQIHSNCLIVPKLMTDFMFGNDLLTEYKAKIDYHKSVIVFNVKDIV